MNSKLQELSDKLYAEGIEKAQADSEAIILQAKKEAKQIIDDANEKKESIIIEVQTEVDRFKKNINSELRMASKQLLSSLKQQISTLIREQVVDSPISEGLHQPETLASVLQTAVKSLNLNDGNIEIKLSEEDHKKISQAIGDGKIKALRSGIIITPDKNMTGGFKIQPESTNYLISFTDEDFFHFFSQFLREQTIEFIDQKENE